ncbi:CBS domain-containing protein [Salinirubrum litoreum]|uniref:CBS domain-containing protein n=1 Tax=Salinirubrum litoreum TaxID=1126234 RepID=A0ABD5RFR2_9EURY|nr:CBS domain-containing protein [Salinirubrum litoreum]
MDISDIVSTEFETFEADTRAAELEAAFGETGAKAVIVTEDGEYTGVVTQRRFASAHRNPDAKAGGLVWHVRTVDRDEDVRTVARAMLGSDSMVLPVFEDGDLYGVVSADDLLVAVRPFLHVLTVEDVYVDDLVSVSPETTVGSVLHTLRDQRITHLPVVDDGSLVGIVSLFDLLDFVVREMDRQQGGSPGAGASPSGGSPHGGFGERAGDVDRMLDLPVADVMTGPVETTAVDQRLDEAVERMLSAGVSSLVVTADGDPTGIVTKTDVLRSLTWTDERRLPVQITNVDLLDDISRAELTDLIEGIAKKYGDLTVLEANVFLHEHDERFRGTPLLMARIRLFTDRGHFVGTGEGYGASHALRLAANVVERQVLEGKTYAQSKKHPPRDEWAKLYGWWLAGESGSPG